MPSTLLTVRDQIVADVEALVPYDDPTASYHFFRDTDGRQFLDGAEYHRFFRFEWLFSDNQHDMGPFVAGGGLAIEEHRFEMRLRENAADRGPSGNFDHIVTESEAVKRLINERQSWPLGVDYVHCARARKEKLPPPSENWDIVFEIVARTQES